MLETNAHKHFDLRHNGEIKMSRIMTFWSYHKIKMPGNIVSRFNREVKMPQDSKVVKKPRN